jgi:hypothetical protein
MARAEAASISTTIDREAIREIAGWHDSAGILSVYVDAGPDRLVGSPPPVMRAARVALEVVAEGAEGGVQRALRERLEALEPTLEALCDPRGFGSGRAAFAAVEGGQVRSFAMQLPVSDDVALAPRPRLRPLIRLAELGQPAGFVLVSRHGPRVVDWRAGDATEIEDLGLGIADPRDAWQAQPPGGRAAHVPNAGDSKDLRDRRADVWVAERLGESTGRLLALAEQRGWGDLVLAGDVQLLHQVADTMPANGPSLVLDTRVLDWKGAGQAAQDLEPVLLRAREDRAREQLRQAQDFAAAGGRGAVGKRDVLAALALGRVEHLFVDCGAAGRDDAELDELVSLAAETDAAVTALDPLTADGTATTAAAILRW